MKREDVKKIFPDATEEQITNILNSHNTEIQTAKKGSISEDELTVLKDKAKKFDDYEADKLTAEEKIQNNLKASELAKSESQKILNKTKAIQEFLNNGFKEDDYKDIIDGIVSDDEEKTVNMAKSFIGVLSKQKKAIEDDIKDKKIHDIHKPGTSNTDDDELSEAEQFATSLSKEVAKGAKSAQDTLKNYINN